MTRKQAGSGRKQTRANPAPKKTSRSRTASAKAAASPAPDGIASLAGTLGLTKAFASQPESAGLPPDVLTVVYVHGIGNKPIASILKSQWDTALFNAPMSDRTRLAYWVNRERYPVPEPGTCASRDEIIEEGVVSYGIRSAGLDDELLDKHELDPAQRRTMAALELKLLASLEPVSGPGVKVLPGEKLRAWVTRAIAKRFLHDVQDFFYDDKRRELMETIVRERLLVGGGPFIVIGHSQGSMIAYNVLRKLTKEDCDVRLFLTLGSPLGLQEVQDVLDGMHPDLGLKVPECVDRWENFAERLDPVALDNDFAKEYAPNSRNVAIHNTSGYKLNPEWSTNPHSATGYLRIPEVRKLVRDTAGSAFFNLLGYNQVLTKDLVADLEDNPWEHRHPTLIQLVASTGAGHDGTLDDVRQRIESRITDLLTPRNIDVEDARIQHMRHFIAADLTRTEIEALRTLHSDLKIARVWRNARKRALMHQSTHTIQVKTANMGYGALGHDIGWAVLDTGIAGGHPHFAQFDTLVKQWDCTVRGAPKELQPGSAASNTLDGNGHGTHVAAVIAGGMTLRDEHGQPIDLHGLAPRAKLYGFKVLEDDGNGEDAWIIKALDIIAGLNERAGKLVIQGVNLSLGGNFDPSVYGCGHTPLCQELRRLWRQGVLVCLAAGNEGYTTLESQDGPVPANMDLSIGDPANLNEAITVGSIHKTNPHTYGVSYFSSRGPTADGRMKPELVAPGENILSASHKWPRKASQDARDYYVEMSGTSMATPHVSGLLAAFLSARREFIGYPEKVKELLLAHCTDLERDRYIQGRGMPNLVKMLMNT
ncbi:MAG: S8 family peptidase [Pseudomonadota bacterium]|nr:S8 family peptidase [Pseudomonadota bacterium]